MKRDQKIWLRLRGVNDARLGKPIDAFYETVAAKRHTEGARAEYEIGYRAAKKEMEHEKAVQQ